MIVFSVTYFLQILIYRGPDFRITQFIFMINMYDHTSGQQRSGLKHFFFLSFQAHRGREFESKTLM